MRKKETTPAELRQAALDGIARVNPALNAVLQVLADSSAKEVAAGIPAGPFQGVPFVIKELVCHAAGVPLDFGSRLARGIVFPHDTELMARFRRAGLVLVGTTQTPELGYNPTTETVLHGPVHNPWMRGAQRRWLERRLGGGGRRRHRADRARQRRRRLDPLSGELQRAGRPEADARPHADRTRRRRPALRLGHRARGLAHGARHRRHARRGLGPTSARRAIRCRRRDPSSRRWAPPGRLRIAFTTKPASGRPIDPECVTAVERTAKLLEELGHDVEEAQPPLDWDAYLRAAHPVWAAFTARGVDMIAQLTGRKPSLDTLEVATLSCYEDGKKLHATDLLAALEYCNGLSRAFGAFFEQYPMLLSADPRAAAGRRTGR